MSKLQPFHLAIPVSNLEKNRIFYRETLGCTEGRTSDHWVDFNFLAINWSCTNRNLYLLLLQKAIP